MEQPKRVLILGAGVMQGPALRLAKARGWITTAADADPLAPCAAMADRFAVVDLKDRAGMEALARSLRDDGGLSGVMTAGTDFSATVAWVAERLGLPGLSYETALDASDKQRMRERFAAAGVPSPRFRVLTSPPDPAAAFELPFPLVVKPVDNMGSRGCRRADSPTELSAGVSDALGYSRSGRVIVEEFMDGPEYSVDALVQDGGIVICGLADRHIRFSPYFIEIGHTIPTALDAAPAKALLDVFRAGVRALGIRNGAAKGDVKLTRSGPMIGEIAARLSGGYMSGWTYPYASGIEPTDGALAIAVGEALPDLTPRRGWTCAERAYLSIPGRVAAVEGLDAARAVPGVRDLFQRARAGDRVRFPENNISKCGNVIAAAPTRVAAVAAAESAVRMVALRLASPDADTEAFLAGGPRGQAVFPPDAFAVPERITAAAAALPDRAAGLTAIAPERWTVHPFPALAAWPAVDYAGRTVAESLDLVRRLTGLGLSADAASPALDRIFWQALLRGGYQGAAYIVDRLRGEKR